MDKNLILQLLHQLTDIHTSGYLSNSSKSSLTPLTSTQLPDIHASGYFMMSIDPVGHSALHYAARLGHKDVVKFLIATAPAAILEMVDTDKSVFVLKLS